MFDTPENNSNSNRNQRAKLVALRSIHVFFFFNMVSDSDEYANVTDDSSDPGKRGFPSLYTPLRIRRLFGSPCVLSIARCVS